MTNFYKQVMLLFFMLINCILVKARSIIVKLEVLLLIFHFYNQKPSSFCIFVLKSYMGQYLWWPKPVL